MKQLLISAEANETRAALLEEGRLVELYVERSDRRSYVGNIYRGRVVNVLAGMDAAFVDIGLEKNGFLYVDDIFLPEEQGPVSYTHLDLSHARGGVVSADAGDVVSGQGCALGGYHPAA